MAKKEKVSDYLKSGKREVLKNRSSQDDTYVRITTETGVYCFVESWKTTKGEMVDEYVNIDNYVKNQARRTANLCNYGDYGGRAAVYKDNATCLSLTKMKASPLLYQEGPYLKLMQLFASQAPREAAPYLFLNLYDRLADCGVTLTIKTSYDIVAIMPPAWSRGHEQLHHLDDLPLSAELSNLVPRYKKGDVVTYRQRRTGVEVKATVLDVVYKQYYQKPYRNMYGNTEYKGSGPYVAWYHTAYGTYRFDEVK